MTTTFCELSEKEVINCTDGCRIGCLTDIELCTEDCRVTALIISKNTGFLCKPETVRIPWEKIEKIGCDVIIVNCNPVFDCTDKHKKDRKKFFFDRKD